MNTLKKIVASSVVVTTMLSLVVAVAPVKAATASAGDLIKMSGNSSVYYLGSDNKRYVFPNEATYKSWYADFSLVKVIPSEELTSLTIGGNVTMRPGTKLVKITTNPKVYAVEPGGILKAIPDEATAKTLYGADWAKRVVDVADAFFINYKDNGASVVAGKYPAGSLVKFAASSPDVYFINVDGTASKVASESAFNASRFQFDNVLDGSAVTQPATGAEITGAVATDLTSGAGTVVYTGGSAVTVALAGNTAASASVIVGQSLANLASFNFTASSDGATKVTGVKFKRSGISQDATLKDVYLYDGNTRVTDSAAVASGIITFANGSGIVTIPAGQTKTLTVKANILSEAAGGKSGESVGISILAAADVTTDGASVSGSFPASGNLMSTAIGTNLATVVAAAPTPTASDVNPGDNGITVWKSAFNIGNHDANFKYLKLREIGSIASTDLKDFELFVNGVKVAGPVQMSSDYYVAFDLNNAPVKMLQGNRNIEVRATVVDGSGKEYTFSLRYAIDVVVEDVEYGVAVTTTGAGVGTATGLQSVAKGNVTVVKKADSASGNVTKDTNSVSLGKYTITAFGEAVKIETLKFGILSNNSSIGSLRNGKVLFNGSQSGSTANLVTASTTGTSYTVNYTVVPGTPVTVEIVADIFDADGVNSIVDTNTIQVSMLPATGNGQAQTSLKTVAVPSETQAVAANTVTVKTGSLTGSKTGTYGDQTVVTPTSAYKIGSYVISGNSTEDVSLNNVTVAINVASGTEFTIADLSDLYIKVDGVQSSVKSTVAATSSFSISKTLVKNGSVVIELYATIGANTATDAIQTRLTVDGQTSVSAASVSTNQVIGQKITAGAGVLTLSALNSDTVVASRIVTGNSTQSVQQVKFVATNESYTVTDLTATTSADAASNIVSAELWDGANKVGTAVNAGGTLTFTGLSVLVNAGSNNAKVLTLKLILNGVGAGAGTTAANLQTTVSGFKANSAQGSLVDTTGTLYVQGNNIYVFGTIPTLANVSLPSTVLTTGANKVIGKFSVTADAQGAIELAQIIASVNASANPTVTNFRLVDADSQTTLATAAGTANGNTIAVTFAPVTAISVSGTKIFEVQADITATTLPSGENVNFNIAASGLAQSANDATAQKGASATFVWSDLSASGHSLATKDWFTDKLVKKIPSDGQSLTK